MSTYASKTSVSVSKSRDEIEATLSRYGADAFGFSMDPSGATIAFRIRCRNIKFVLNMPDAMDPEFTHHSRGPRTDEVRERYWKQACLQRWRALALVIKAKLEAIDAGIVTFEDEFLANTVMLDGRTVSETIQEKITEHYRIGGPPPIMLEHKS